MGGENKGGISVAELKIETLPLTVNYGLPVELMVRASHYDHVDPSINSESFPLDDQETEVMLVHFGLAIYSWDVLNWMGINNQRAGELRGLLAFGAKYPDKQREFRIVALGSVRQLHNGCCYVPSLCRMGEGRKVECFQFNTYWPESCRFLAFHK